MENKSIYIMNLESAHLYKDFVEGVKTNIENKDILKLFSATIPYSLETIRINEYKPESIYCIGNKQYTKSIINVEFNSEYFIFEKMDDGKSKKKVIAKSKKIRKHMYENGFYIEDVHYVFYKRGAGKAKNGDVLFIRDDMVDYLRKRSRVELDFSNDEYIDFTSLLAYESLIMSGIDTTINIDLKEEMLLIEDIYGMKFNSNANVTEEIDGKLISTTKSIELKNCLSDGQGMLDESKFIEIDKNDKGFALLRNDMLKSCAFNTKLQEFFAENNITELVDMFGNKKDAKKIKLVITPNSFKFLKFSHKFKGDTDEERQLNCFNHYLENGSSTFGIVKFDKLGNYGNYNRTTYQLLNSIPFITKEDMSIIAKDEIDYVNLLSNDMEVFLNYIGLDSKSSIKFEMSDGLEDEDKMDNIELMNAIMLVNSDIKYTKKFKAMKKELIKNYIKNLNMGKLRMKNTVYATLFSNPYEFLLSSIGQYENKSIMNGREIWCSRYPKNQELCASRNPHVNSGNVMHTVNRYRDEYKWFNLTDNICAINFFDNDAPDRLQGCDTDSDTLLLLPSSTLVKYAKLCEEQFYTPINKVKGKPKPRKNKMSELASLDTMLSNNYIGQIINLSQIINSYMNDAIQNKLDNGVIQELYDASCKCSSLSQIEIDKSKKTFDNVNMSNELKYIRNISSIQYIITDKDSNVVELSIEDYIDLDSEQKKLFIKKMVVPNFFQRISDSHAFRYYKKMNTPMDLLEDVLVFDKIKGTKTLSYKDLVIQPKDIVGDIKDFNSSQMPQIYEIISDCGRKINGLRMDSCKLNNLGKKTVERNSKNNAIRLLSELTITQATALDIVRVALRIKEGKFDFSKYSLLALNLLFLTDSQLLLNCFKSKDMSDDLVLCNFKNNGINIFGKTYIKKPRKDMENTLKLRILENTMAKNVENA